jgi:phage FluMu gp28-like protein
LLRAASITLPGGSRVIAVPGKPDTVRGYSANVLLTEFAFFEDAEATWKALVPSAGTSFGGVEKKVRVITTPNGMGNKAYDLWMKNQTGNLRSGSTAGAGPLWARHFVDIHTAKLAGLPVNVEELRAALDDPDGWAQEYECQFLDVQTTLLPYDLIGSCESIEATTAVGGDFWNGNRGLGLVMGIDFGRKQDLTVAWTLNVLGDVRTTVEVLEMARMGTPEQVELLRPRIRQARRVCLDYTGAGIGMGDYLVKEFGEYSQERHLYGKIELCHFSNALKLEVFSKLRMAFERRELRVPVSRVIREDLHSVNRVSSAAGQVTYRAARSADGHADRCTALALAVRAGEKGAVGYSIESVKLKPGPRSMGMARFTKRDADAWSSL